MSPRARGYGLIAAGVLFNNYVYMHDVVVGKHGGFIHAGLWSLAGILLAAGIIAAGAWLLARSS